VSRSLRLGLIPLADAAGIARANEFASAVGALLRETVELHNAADYRALVAALEQGVVHFAWLPPIAAARATRSQAIRPAAIAVRNGTTSYMTGLITLKDGPIHSLGHLKAVRAAWVDRESASGYVVIRSALRAAGVILADAFREEIFVRSHAEVARAVKSGRVDVGATCFNVGGGAVAIARTGYREEPDLPSADIRIVAQAGPIPSDMFAVHAALPEVARRKLEGAFADGAQEAFQRSARRLMHADGFARATPAHLTMLERLFDTVTGR
jgi:phosphate/phosphite/phosphonate ABC transporter binding protein